MIALGYDEGMARRIVSLLEEEELLDYCLRKAGRASCVPVTRASEAYPLSVRKHLGLDSPGCLWAKGDLSILEMPKVSLVGSRVLQQENREFAAEAGRQAAEQGFALVSGNAKGADQMAQEACLDAGGCVISVVADELDRKEPRERMLYLSEEDFDAPFSAIRALSRNRVIHSLGQMTFVAQSGYETGGTWDGTVKNLRFGWSPVYVYADGSPAQCVLADMGAQPVDFSQLSNFLTLPAPVADLFTNGGNTHEQSR
jgi:predicted Rossmann fold nucleotide-binding protein DprA/Smf involved in DNA uptake